MYRLLVLFFLAGTALTATQAQDRCGTVPYDEQRHRQNPALESPEAFETWMRNMRQQGRQTQGAQRTHATVTIPVVVHVIHAGEAIGTGRNILTAQIESQLRVLNEDFQRLNADRTLTPTEFLGVAGAFDVEFVLAKRDPEGLPTDGIVRVAGPQPSWTIDNNQALKSLSYWPADDYLNVWVVELTDLLGYAQFPVSNLPGTNEGPKDALTDGVVVDFRSFGSRDDGPFGIALDPKYDKGRTATHEVGHFFGLRHIWGDENGCDGTDHVDDTPNQSIETRGCPSHPQTSCAAVKMFQNYMDYTDDRCMNIFTAGQVSRMDIVLSNSPRRASLASSLGAIPPVAMANDLGIRAVVAPKATACPGASTPIVEVRNYGTNTITSARIALRVNNVLAETKNVSLSLAPLATAEVVFAPVNLPDASTVELTFDIEETNGTSDGNAANDSRQQSVSVPATISVPFFESLASVPPTWTIQNPDGLISWAPITSSGGVQSQYINFYDYEDEGARDYLITPRLVLDQPAAVLQFDRAYAKFSNTEVDRLRVSVSASCDFSQAQVVFDKAGDALATAPGTTARFIPTPAQWITETISLGSVNGSTVQIAFEGINDFGNNLYLRNVRLLTSPLADAALVAIEEPSPVTCERTVTPRVRVQNTGSGVPITALQLRVQVNNGAAAPLTISGLNIPEGEQELLALGTYPLATGENTLTVEIIGVNNGPEQITDNNLSSKRVIVNEAADIAPLRERFETVNPAWTIVSQGTDPEWTYRRTNKGQSLRYEAFEHPFGAESWLVSPVLDLTQPVNPILYFDLSYRSRSTEPNETIRLLGSTDCGITFFELLPALDLPGQPLASAWVPASDADWQLQTVNLQPLAGADRARVAWVVTSGNGNNLYLDNIEFFIANNKPSFPVEEAVAIYGKNPVTLTFNLAERQDVRLQLLNLLGQPILDTTLPNTLNQTYTLDTTMGLSGLYIVRLQMGNQRVARKIYLD